MQKVALAARSRVTRMLGLAPVSAAGGALSGDRLALFEQACSSDEARQKIINFSTGGRLSATWCAAVAQAAGRAHLPQAIKSYLLQWGQGDIAQAASQLGLPTWVLVGQHDPSINLASVAHNWLKHHPQALVQEIAGVGHYPMLEAPVSVGSVIERWLLQAQA
jgi:pimeloyl-ACP methyl ester carboxylesterase